MISFLLILGIVFFLASITHLMRFGQRAGAVKFACLLWLHVVVGLGYVFLSLYRQWELGPRYPSSAHVEFDEFTMAYVSVLCVFLFALSLWHTVRTVSHVEDVSIKLRVITLTEIAIVGTLVGAYLLGLRFNTLSRASVGVVVLPFRLNGLIELTTVFILPFYVSLRALSGVRGFWIGLVVIAMYSLVNITMFGAKYTAVYPMAVFLTMYLGVRRIRIRQVATAALLVISLYVFLNPYYFAVRLNEIGVVSITEAVSESARSAHEGGLRLPTMMLVGVRNMAYRTTGIVPMQQAASDSVPLWDFSDSRRVGMILQPNQYYNDRIARTDYGTSDAVGHFGFFILLFRNHFFGFVIGCGVLLVIVWISEVHDRLYRSTGFRYYTLQGLAFVLLTLDFIVDGNYDNLSGYLKLAFGMVVARMFAKELLGEGRARGRSFRRRHPMLSRRAQLIERASV